MGALPAVPRTVVNGLGRPAFGAYTGVLDEVRWGGLRGEFARGLIWSRLHAKRWHYASVAGPKCLVALATVDIGWAVSAFAYVFDRVEKRLLCDLSFMGVPGLSARIADRAGEGARTRFSTLGAGWELSRPRGSLHWTLRGHGPRGFRIDARLDARGAPPELCAIVPIENGVANCTHKTVGLAASGFVEAGGTRFELDGAWGALDHTSGLLARRTWWRWASASGRGIGLNLVEGFNGPAENVVWLDGAPHPVGPAKFEFDPQRPLEPWRITTENGLVDLTFKPEGARSEDKQLVVAASHYVQPIGAFSGTLRASPDSPLVKVDGLPGVTEDHASVW
jgi:hypothetical protein